MNLLRKIRNVLRGLLQRYAPASLKRTLWNYEFATNRWSCLENGAPDPIYEHVERYANGGTILDLGCGPGTHGNELKPSAYRAYTGVDISDVAIEKARARAAEIERQSKHRYYQSDISSYVPDARYDVLLFADSLYYVPIAKLGAMLLRYCPYLNEGGVFIARLYDSRGKFGRILEVIRGEFAVLECTVYPSHACIIVFRPHGGSAAASPVDMPPRESLKVGLLTGGQDKDYALGLSKGLSGLGVSLDFVGSDDMDVPAVRAVPRLTFLNLRGNQRRNASTLTKMTRVLIYYVRLFQYATIAQPRVFHILWNNKFEMFDRTVLMAFYKVMGRKVIFTAHNVNAAKRDLADSWLNRVTLRTQYRLADHIFVHTEKMKDELVGEFGVSPSAVTVIPFGVNTVLPDTSLTALQARRQLGLEAKDRVLLFFGRIGEYKGLHLLVAAFERLLAGGGDYRLVIAGERKVGADGYWEEIAARIARSSFADRVVQRIGYVRDEEAEIYFKAADVLVLPYTRIFQSGVLFAAYGFGLPVIATDVGSFAEDVIEGQTGFISKPDDPEDLAATIEKYFASPLYQSLPSARQAIRRHALDRYSLDTIGRMTRDVYDAVLAETSA